MCYCFCDDAPGSMIPLHLEDILPSCRDLATGWLIPWLLLNHHHITSWTRVWFGSKSCAGRNHQAARDIFITTAIIINKECTYMEISQLQGWHKHMYRTSILMIFTAEQEKGPKIMMFLQVTVPPCVCPLSSAKGGGRGPACGILHYSMTECWDFSLIYLNTLPS